MGEALGWLCSWGTRELPSRPRLGGQMFTRQTAEKTGFPIFLRLRGERSGGRGNEKERIVLGSFRAKAKTKVRQLRGGGGLEDRRF